MASNLTCLQWIFVLNWRNHFDWDFLVWNGINMCVMVFHHSIFSHDVWDGSLLCTMECINIEWHPISFTVMQCIFILNWRNHLDWYFLVWNGINMCVMVFHSIFSHDVLDGSLLCAMECINFKWHSTSFTSM